MDSGPLARAACNSRISDAAAGAPYAVAVPKRSAHSKKQQRNAQRNVKKEQLIRWTQAVASCKRWPEAVLTVADFQSRGFETDIVLENSVLTSCGRGQQWQKASAYLRRLSCGQLQLTRISFNSAVNAFSISARWRDAASLSEQSSCDMTNDAILHNSVISALAKRTCWIEAFALLAHMTKTSVKCTLMTLSATVTACDRVGHWQEALLLLSATSALGIRPDSVMQTSCINVCEKGDQWQQALVTLSSCKACRSRGAAVNAYNAAISACERSSQWEQALAVFSSLFEQNVKADVISYNAMISACKQHWKLSMFFLGSLLQSKLQPTLITFNAALSAFDSTGLWMEALGVLVQLQDHCLLPDLITFHALLACNKTEWRRACMWLTEVDGRYLQRDLVTQSAIITACTAAEQWELSLFLGSGDAHRASGAGDAHTVTDTIVACDRGGMWESTLWLLESMADVAVEGDTIACNAAMAACASQGAWSQVLFGLRELQLKELSALAYDAAVVACANAEKASFSEDGSLS